MANEDLVSKLESPKEAVKEVLQEFVSMNKAAIVHSEFLKFIEPLTDTDFVSVAEIKSKFKEFEILAENKMKVFSNLL